MNTQLSIHYNTTHLKGAELTQARSRAGSLNDKILEFFLANHSLEFTPPEVWEKLGNIGPLTSTRRALSTLTKLGWLEKTDNKKAGLFGEDNYTWKLKHTK